MAPYSSTSKRMGSLKVMELESDPMKLRSGDESEAATHEEVRGDREERRGRERHRDF
ncbi:hypothetical protein CCACVL1_29896 [Corchorus capsularis]|uniref:Uncharacterized protein n=1 Tax=Corchorus capsularis TaxID=210143 RepID=A0A1R3FZT1_COCAP|nr:hypothetical protein CCACVL1_29896 [Corchorus capsularis]